jgi:hypothetical protein
MEEERYRVMGTLKAENAVQPLNVDASMVANSPMDAIALLIMQLIEHGYVHPTFTTDPIVSLVDTAEVA